jgi:hypothetical protein
VLSGIAAIPGVAKIKANFFLVYGANSVVWRQANASMGAADKGDLEPMCDVGAFEVQP